VREKLFGDNIEDKNKKMNKKKKVARKKHRKLQGKEILFVRY